MHSKPISLFYLRALLFISFLTVFCFTKDVTAQCKLLDRSKDAVNVDFLNKSSNGDDAILKLINNSSCPIIIYSGSFENFVKSRKMPTEIEYVLPDKAFVHEIQYRYNLHDKQKLSVGGDNFYGFIVSPGFHITFEVPISHFGKNCDQLIGIPFDYQWKFDDRAKIFATSVETIVYFSGRYVPCR